MWIKRLLVIVPVCVLLFLALSVLWVPRNTTVAQNPARAEVLVFYMGANPEDMNAWTSTKASDSDISDYMGEGLITSDRNFDLLPNLAESITVSHRVTMKVPDGTTGEALQAELRRMYGENLRSFEQAKPAGEIRVNLGTGKMLDAKDQPSAGDVVFTIATPETVKFMLAPAVEKGKINSSVDAEIEEKLEKWLGRKPYASLDMAGLSAKALAAVPEDKKAAITQDQVNKALEPAINGLGAMVFHEQIVDFYMRKGVHWIDGPFFKKEDLIDKETGKERRHFGDENGPWWCEGPELTARDPKLTFDYLRDPDFGSPRMSSYLNIKETKIFDDNPYRFQVRYEEFYSLAVGDLGGSLLPYHIWNRKAWTEEAIRKGRGPKDVGVPEDPKIGQWDPVPPGKYKPFKFLPAREREFSLKPSTIGAMVLEPLNGNALPLWSNGSKVRLRRNEFYFGRKPEYQFIDYYVFDPAMGRETTEIVFLSGGVDSYGCKEYQVERYLQMKDQYQVVQRLHLGYEYVAFNCQREQLKDKNVRLALSFAINVADIMEYVVYNQGERINGPNSKVLPWYNPDHMITHKWRSNGKDKEGKVIDRVGKEEKFKFLPYDMDEARAILFEVGYRDVNGKMVKDGKPLRINLINSTSPGPRRATAILAKEQWEKLGVDVDYKEYEWNVFIQQKVMALDYDVCVLGWQLGSDFDIRQLWHSKCFPTDGGLNLAAYHNEEADKLMDKIITVFDYPTQEKMARQIFDIIADDFPYVFLYNSFTTGVMDKHIVWRREVGKNPDGTPILEDRPVNHEYIRTGRQKLKYYHGEFKRVDKVPEWKEEDYKR